MTDLTPETLDPNANPKTLRLLANLILRGVSFQEIAVAESLRLCASAWAADRKDAQWKHAFDEGEVCGLMTHTADTDNPYEEASNQYCGWSFGFWSGRGIADRKRIEALERERAELRGMGHADLQTLGDGRDYALAAYMLIDSKGTKDAGLRELCVAASKDGCISRNDWEGIREYWWRAALRGEEER